jgi:hypothetical protein
MAGSQTFSLPSEKRRESLGQAAVKYAEHVDEAIAYLANRGMAEFDVISDWMLGVVRDPLPGHERVEGWLSIPYLSPGGVLDIKYRCMADHDHQENGHPKYIGETGSTARLFGVTQLAVDSEILAICEGELDTITCASTGLPAVGVSGANKWMPWWAYCFEGYSEIVVLQDGDANGAGEKLSRTVVSACENARIVPMPLGHDVNSFVQEFGPQALRERIGL